MREVLETPGKTAALVTPDPSIARRVSAELARWGVEVEDSAGRALGETEAGALARLVLQAALEFRPLAVQALIAHPAARFGRSRAEKDAAARALEIGVFRAAPIRALDDLDAAFEAARAAAEDRHAHPAVRVDRRSEARRGRAPRARLRGGARPFARAQTLDAARRLARRPSRSARRRARGARRRPRRAARTRGARGLARRVARGGRRRLSLRARPVRSARRRRACGRARPARAGRPSAASDPRPARSAPPRLRPRADRRPRRKGLAAVGRHRRASSTGRCARSSGFRRPSGGSAKRRTISPRRSARARRF